jgi:hypothetical protein
MLGASGYLWVGFVVLVGGIAVGVYRMMRKL